MGNQHHTVVFTAVAIDTFCNDFECVDVQTRVVSSSSASLGCNKSSCMISLRFFSPPLKPRSPALEEGGPDQRCGQLAYVFHESGGIGLFVATGTGQRSMLALRNSMLLTPGISTGYGKPKTTQAGRAQRVPDPAVFCRLKLQFRCLPRIRASR